MKVGLQLQSIKGSIDKDRDGTLRKISELGFKYVEAMNYDALFDYGVGIKGTDEEIKKQMERFGLKIVGNHINPIMEDTFDDVIESQKRIGVENIGCDIEFFPFDNVEYLKRRCETYNNIGKRCKDNGMRFYYHNHYQEFQKIPSLDNMTVYDFIMENTDPELMYIDLDLYWAARAGQNSVKLIRKYKNRIIMVGLTDFPEDAGEAMMIFHNNVDKNKTINLNIFRESLNKNAFTEIGSGVLPIPSYIRAARDCPNIEYMIIQQNHTKLDDIESARISMEFIKKFRDMEF